MAIADSAVAVEERVLSHLRATLAPGEKVFVSPVADKFFGGESAPARVCLEALRGRGQLEQFSQGRMSLLRLPVSSPTEERKDMANPVIRQRKKVRDRQSADETAASDEDWASFSKRPGIVALNFQGETDFKSRVKEAGDNVGQALAKRQTEVLGVSKSVGGRLISVAKRYLRSQGEEVIDTGKSIKRQEDRLSAVAVNPGGKTKKAKTTLVVPAKDSPAEETAIDGVAATAIAHSDLAEGMMAMLTAAATGRDQLSLAPEVRQAMRVGILMGPLSMQAGQAAQLPLVQVVRKALEFIAADPAVTSHIEADGSLKRILQANQHLVQALDLLAGASANPVPKKE